MNVLSLFSGIGGLDLGLQRAGMTIAGQVEIDPWCRKVLEKHWPEVPRHDDVRTSARWWGGRPAPDVVCGGFPCQPVSQAGKGLAQADSRWLWPAFADVIRALRPRYVIVENVPGLLGRGMGNVLGDLAAIGYDSEWDCVPACFVGAPHIRNRVWIVAYPNASSGGRRSQGRNDWLGAAGLHPHVADTSSIGRLAERPYALTRGAGAPAATGEPGWVAPPADGFAGEGCPDVPDAAGDRRAAEGQRAAPGRPDWSDHLRRGRQADHAAHADRQPLGWTPEPRCEHGYWSAEPDVGGALDGLSAWLDGSGRLEQSHKLLLAYGKTSSGDAAETVRALRDAVRAEDGQREAGGRWCLSAAEVLLAYLRKLENHCRQAGEPLARETSSQDDMRGMRLDEIPARPPLRREPSEQRPGQPPDALHALSQLLARHAEQAWAAYRRSDAAPVLYWESGVVRVAHGIPARVDRLRGLGNAVVPQVAEHIGRMILTADGAAA